jgi:glycosyltransferase involved in cell wall biosynthesis
MKLSLFAVPTRKSGYGEIAYHLLYGLPKVGYEPDFISLIENYDPKLISDGIHGKLIPEYNRTAAHNLVVHPMDFRQASLLTPVYLKLDRKIHLAMWETSRIRKDWASMLNSNVAVIVPCEWNKKTFEEAGVSIPVFKVSLGISTDIYNYKEPNPNNPFTIGIGANMLAGTVDPRKKILDLPYLFAKAFPNQKDVKLKIKATGYPKRYTDPRIDVNVNYITEKELADWYASLDVFLSVSKGEGWGFMQHQAMAIGRPLVSHCYGGLSEFFDNNVGYVIPHKLVEATGYYSMAGGQWAESDNDVIIETLRWLYNNRDDVLRKGKLSAERAGQFTIEKMVLGVGNVLNIMTECFV